MLIRDSLWKRRYGGDAGLVGRRLDIGGKLRTVIGVMPDTFEFPSSGEIWLPLDDLTLGGTRQAPAEGLRVFGVLRPGVTFEAATVELDELSRQVARSEGTSRDVRMHARPYAADSGQAATAMSALVPPTSSVMTLVSPAWPAT